MLLDSNSLALSHQYARRLWVRARSLAGHPWAPFAGIFVWCGFLFFYGLNAGELYRNEGLRAIVAEEFLRSGNWTVPTLYGEPLYTKPPGMYAAIALVSWPFGGVSEATARLPSALAATATVLLMFWYFGRQLGKLGGLIAGTIAPMSLMWLDKVPAAEIDMLQVAWTTAAICCFLRALENAEERQGSTLHWWTIALLCVCGGTLTKWTCPAFFYGTAIPLLWWRGRLRLLFGRAHLFAAGLGALVFLAWVAAAVSQTGWHLLYDTVSREALQRLSPGHYPRPYRWSETFAHPFIILAASLPWSVAALFTLRPGFMSLWDERGKRLLQALHCWVWPSLLFWSLAAEHSPRHCLPLIPAISGLATFVLFAWMTGRMRWPLRRVVPGSVLLGMVVVWLSIKLVFVHGIVPARNHGREPCGKGEELAASVPEGETLYLFRLKDEGVMFYYGQKRLRLGANATVRRMAAVAELPAAGGPVYCLLNEAEWRDWQSRGQGELVLATRDQQGDPIALLRFLPDAVASGA